MQMFPLVSALVLVVIAAVIVLWKAGASAGPERAVPAANEPLMNQTPNPGDERR